jgi:hypothetical protein
MQVVVWAADDKGRWRPLASAEPPTVGAWVTHVVWDTPPSVGAGSAARADSVLYGVTSEDAPDLTTIRWLEEGGSTGIVFVSGRCGRSRALAHPNTMPPAAAVIIHGNCTVHYHS